MRFKIGDKVWMIDRRDRGVIRGLVGSYYSVEFEGWKEQRRGHKCETGDEVHCPNGGGWFASEGDLEPYVVLSPLEESILHYCRMELNQ